MKKHITQMTREDIEKLTHTVNNMLTGTRRVKFSGHAIERIIEKNIDGSRILAALKNADIIEYHLREHSKEQSDKRVLLRSRDVVDNKNFCVVLSLDKNKVITVYVNNVNDTHSTLDKSKITTT